MNSGAHIEASAPAKLFLLGEYGVLEGGPALLTGLAQRARVSLNLNTSGVCVFSAAQLDIHELPCELAANGLVHAGDTLTQQKLRLVREVFTRILSACPEVANRLSQGFSLDIDTAEFFAQENQMKLGLGSSAAVAASLSAALLCLKEGGAAKPQAVFQMAQAAHHKVQGGRGSGADIGLSVHGGLLSFCRGNAGAAPEFEALVWPDDLEMLAFYSGQSVSTSQVLKRLDAYAKANQETYHGMMHTLKRLAQDGLEAIRRKESGAFLNVVNVFQGALNTLAQSATLDAIDVLPQAFKQEIADLGGATKISGAGGDVALLFYRDVEAGAALKSCVKKHGFSIVPIERCMEPLRVKFHSDELKS
ncbi:MAG: hypothetical protein QGI45_11675 [Myxococcota bacterium]|nr:hypothetical protein [Myxococcota bacterium]